jgi:hypothetical protein
MLAFTVPEDGGLKDRRASASFQVYARNRSREEREETETEERK